MSNRTDRNLPPRAPTDQGDAVTRQALSALADALGAHAVLEARLASLDARQAALWSALDTRLASLDTRLASLSLPEQLQMLAKLKSAMELHLREGVMQLEWFASMSRKVRELVTDLRDDMSPETGPTLPNIADLATSLGSNGPQRVSGLEGVDVPPELQSVFADLFGKKKS